MVRTAANVDERLRDCELRRRGQYPPAELAAIVRAGVKPVYAQITPAKTLIAASFLQELYLGAERPWRIEPTPVPRLLARGAGGIEAELGRQVALEAQTAAMGGSPVGEAAMYARAVELAEIAERDQLRAAWRRARRVTAAVDDVLTEGGFYDALGEFIRDFVTYPYAVLRGPVMRMRVVDERREDGTVEQVVRSVPTWSRVDPSLIWWTPGSNRVGDALVIEVMPFLPSDLEAYIGQPGFDTAAIRRVVERWGETGWRALSDDMRRPLDDRHAPQSAPSSLAVIEVVALSGRVPGSVLLRMSDLVPVGASPSPGASSPGAPSSGAPSPGAPSSETTETTSPDTPSTSASAIEGLVQADRTYFVQAWVVADTVIYFELSEDPEAIPPYAIASYDPLPGSLVGRALPEMLSDVQDAANATLRALVANVAVASGPQVVVDVDRLADRTTAIRLSPWKVWPVVSDPTGGSAVPISFYAPPLNIDQLVASLQAFLLLADEVSGLPRYMGGSSAVGTLGRTASGVSMVMARATQVMRTIARSIDTFVLQPNITRVHKWLLRNDPELGGDLQVVVRGATRMLGDDVRRARLLELLTVTTNPVDLQLIGMEGRLKILQGLADDLGLSYDQIVPTLEQLRAAQQASQTAAPSGSPSRPSPPVEGAP
jgi:hypothetical protein